MLHKKSIISVFVLFFQFFLFAETVVFPILGFKTVPKEPIMLEAEWEEAWFGEKTAFDYHHGICRIACIFSEISYVEDVVENPEGNVIFRSYKALGIKNEDMRFHYDIDYDALLGNNQSGVTFAHKTIKSALGEKTLVFCVVRGTPRNANEWISNVNLSDSTKKAQNIHEGFFISADQIYRELLDYLFDKKIDKKDAFFLITGHSRGAAVANMLGAIIANTENFDTKKVYLYTFGTPNVTSESDCNSEKYGFIWNIESIEDLCATLPPDRHGWAYKKYGKTRTLVNRWSCEEEKFEGEYLSRMNIYFNRFLLRDFHPFRIGPFFPSQISRLFVILNPEVSDFYKKGRGLKNKCEFIFKVVFPKKEKRKKSKSLFGTVMFSMLNWGTNGAFGYANIAVFDMHMCEGYLSWLMALSEEEVFAECASSQLVLSGSFDAVITNSKGEALVTIKDGLSAFSAIKTPAAAMSLGGKTVVGLGGNEDFTVEILHDSIIPSPMTVKIEHYSADGIFEGSSKRLFLSQRSGEVISFKAGKATAESFDLEIEKIKRENASDEAKKLPSAFSLLLSPSISVNTDFETQLALDAGVRALYASASYSNDFWKIGAGSRQNLFWRLYLDEGVYAKHISGVSVFPSATISLSYKPFHTVHFFAAGDFDFEAKAFGFEQNRVSPDFRLGIKL